MDIENIHSNGDVADIAQKLEKSLSIETDDKMESYHRFIQNGKDVARQGDMEKALKFFKLAHGIHPSEKLGSRIKKIEELIAQNDSDEDEEEFINVNNSGLMLFKDLHEKLYDYQRNGVAFLYSLYRDGRKGGILADDMGLGKTIQVISFLSGMFDSELAKHTLLIMPTSLITNWTKEFAKWTPGMRVKEFHGTSKTERTRNLEKVQRRGGVVITTYTMLMNNWQQLSTYQGREFRWDYVILDEAHKIKTSTTKTAKSAHNIPSKNRVLLTGTPVQNNLKEMWALFDYALQGTLLGTAKTFKTEYENPITRAREKDATPGEKVLGSRMSENLMATIKPYFLRRTKAEVQKNKMNGTHPCKEEFSDNKERKVPANSLAKDTCAIMPTLTRKNDLIVWTYLSAAQEDIYRQFISLEHIKELLMTTRSPLAELTILKKLCDHPRLLSAAAVAKLGLQDNQGDGDAADTDTNNIANIPDDTLIAESGKMVFLFALLERLREEGHRTLVFAHYRKVLDILERILGNRGFKTLRLDGTITQLAERERRITQFQTDERFSVFLLTTQVGGVGITLTAADRVVIYDPSWNPATDAQAVDRAYRIGQTENVVIYRLITCGTVEEKIYRRQVFKDSLIRQNTGDKKNPFRYFSKQELKELFSLEDTRSSSTQMQLQTLHSRHRRTDPELDEHIAVLHSMEMFGISDHDLMFSVNLDEETAEDQEAHVYIEGRVQKAQELMKAESELQMQLAESMASSTEPAWLRQPVENYNNRERSNEKTPRNPRPSPSYPPQHDRNFDKSPVVVVESEEEAGASDHSDGVIDLGSDEGMAEQEESLLDVSPDEQILDPHQIRAIKQERVDLEMDNSKNKTPKNSRASLSYSTPVRLDSSPTGSDQENGNRSRSQGVIDLTRDEGMAEQDVSQHRRNVDSTKLKSVKQERREDASPQDSLVMSEANDGDDDDEIMDESAVSKEVDGSLSYITASEDEDQPLDETADAMDVSPLKNRRISVLQALNSSVRADNETSRDGPGRLESSNGTSNSNDDSKTATTVKKNQRISVLQASNSSFAVDNSSRASTGLESFEGNFNLQLEDSDMFSEHEGHQDNQESEAEETNLLSKLQIDGSFDVNKSLSEQQRKHKSLHGQSLNNVTDDSIIMSKKKKKAAVIYDSEEEDDDDDDDDDDEGQEMKSQLENSFKALGASTPKSAPSVRRKSLGGGNTSVASRRSLVHSIIQDIDEQDAQDGSKEEDTSDSRISNGDGDGHSSLAAEESDDIIGATNEELELDETTETTGETINTEEELEDTEEMTNNSSSSSLDEESTGGPELASSEAMDQCTASEVKLSEVKLTEVKLTEVKPSEVKESEVKLSEVKLSEVKDSDVIEQEGEIEGYDWLVSKGRESYSEGKLDEALGLFLRAIDIKPGDPEVQLLTIQLYRQLSQKR